MDLGDLASRARDRAADARDLAAGQRDQADERDRGARAFTGAEVAARMGALRDRAARQRASTGTRTRAAGLADLDRELDRCRRASGRLTVAYVDVAGLRALDHGAGHGCGDELLTQVVTLIRRHLRSYDLIVRLGRDELLCAMPTMAVHDGRARPAAATCLDESR